MARTSNSEPIVLLSAGTVGGSVETQAGIEVDVRSIDTLGLYIDYTNGDEGTLYVYPKYAHTSDGNVYPWQDWTASAGDKTPTDNRLELTATDNAYAVFDVRGISYVEFWRVATNPAPTAAPGTLGLTAILTSED